MQSAYSQRPVSEVPTLSSLYSQPSPDFDGPRPYESESSRRGDISPPDTPNLTGDDQRGHRASPDVSPISATPSPTAFSAPALSSSGSKRYASNLPLPKSTTKKFWKLPNSAKGSEDPESSNVRWDEYSGEPTAGDRGKPPSATPGSVKLRETSSPLRLRPNFGTSTTITSNNVPPRKRVGNREVADAPIIIRPEWKGAGGRHSIVKPLFDKPLQPHQPRELPPGIQTRWLEEMEHERVEAEHALQEQAQRDAERTEQEVAQEAADTARQAKERAAQDQREREREQQQRMARVRIEKAKREREKILHAQEESERRAKERIDRVPLPVRPDPLRISSKPSTPTEIRSSSAPGSPQSHSPKKPEIVSQSPAQSEFDSRTPEPTLLNLYNPKSRLHHSDGSEESSALFRTSSGEGVLEQQGRGLSGFSGLNPSNPSHSIRTGSPAHASLQSETIGTESNWQDAHQAEFRPPSELDILPAEHQLRSRFSATTIATTAYDTSPPQTPDMASDGPGCVTPPGSILNRRRPVAPAGVIRRKPAPSLLGTPNSMPREDAKKLPNLPPDADAANPIEALQAKVDVLRRRRRNLEGVIEELNNVVQPSSIAYDRTSRAEIKKTLASLEKELSEVVKDEHDTGLRLLRAWKRHEAFAAFEPTMIWVRRVTH